jgi:hypothetical protein
MNQKTAVAFNLRRGSRPSISEPKLAKYASKSYQLVSCVAVIDTVTKVTTHGRQPHKTMTSLPSRQ